MWLISGILEEIGYLHWQVELGMTIWLASGIPEEIGYMCWQIKLGRQVAF